MRSGKEAIHEWRGITVLKSLITGAILEGLAIGPAILSPWGHAGPESLWGWLGLMLNVPGLAVIWFVRTLTRSTEGISVTAAIVYVYLIQTVIFAYLTFVWLRWKKSRAR